MRVILVRVLFWVSLGLGNAAVWVGNLTLTDKLGLTATLFGIGALVCAITWLIMEL
jgi:hypothetical protein